MSPTRSAYAKQSSRIAGFLLARLHVDSLLDKRIKRKVLSTLNKLSKGSTALNDAYSEVIKWIDGQLAEDHLLARHSLSWISYAQTLWWAAGSGHEAVVTAAQNRQGGRGLEGRSRRYTAVLSCREHDANVKLLQSPITI